MADLFDQEVVHLVSAKGVAAHAGRQAIRGYYIHTITSFHGERGENFLVVYRKAKD
jgi:hypothetical protein